MSRNNLITTRELAGYMNRSISTIKNWVAAGHITPVGRDTRLQGEPNLFNPDEIWIGKSKAARVIGVSLSTVTRWMEEGRLDCPLMLGQVIRAKLIHQSGSRPLSRLGQPPLSDDQKTPEKPEENSEKEPDEDSKN